MIFSLCISCTTTQRRVFIRRHADTNDYKYFQACTIRKEAVIMQFPVAPDPAVETVLKNTFGSADIVIARFGRQYGMDPWKYLSAFYTMCTAEQNQG
jgi:hypothetical protein